MKKALNIFSIIFRFLFGAIAIVYGGLFVSYTLIQGFSVGQFFPVITSMLLALIGFVLVVIMAVFTMFKRNDIAKVLFVALVGYYVITTFKFALDGTSNFTGEAESNLVAVSVINIFRAILLLISVGVIVAGQLFKIKKYKIVFNFVGAGLFYFYWLLTFASGFGTIVAQLVAFDDAVNVYITIVRYFFLPGVILLGFIYFFMLSDFTLPREVLKKDKVKVAIKEETPVDVESSEVKEENKQEETKEETPQA